MFIPFQNLPATARVWVYQSNRRFTDNEVTQISEQAKVFIEQWTRHGDDLKGSFTIRYNQFLILAVDESFNNASGCSIDASVRFVQQIMQALNVDLLDKMNISFKENDEVKIVKMADFQQLAKENKITANTVVFNNMVNTKAQVDANWEVTANKSWHQRFLV